MDERGLVVTFHVSTKTMVEYSSMMGKFPTVYFTLFYSVFRIHMFFFPPGSGSTSQSYGSEYPDPDPPKMS